jgi:hypothetical protein
MSDPEHIDPAATAASRTSRASPHITVDGKAVMHVAVAMSALSPNNFPIAVTLGKVGWGNAVTLPIKPDNAWLDREWNELHASSLGFARPVLLRDGLSGRAVARVVAVAARDHVLAARMVGYQHHWLCGLLDLCDDLLTLDWIEYRDFLNLVAREVMLPEQRLLELVGRQGAIQRTDRIGSDVAEQLKLTGLVVSESRSTVAPSNPPTTLALKRAGSSAS